MRNWRFIETGAAAPAWNMAVDEAILMAHAEGMVPPTVRAYAWKPPGLSLGYAQKVEEDLIEVCERRGAEVVRRITGGRAILHHLEVTYSVVMAESLLGDNSSLAASYQLLSQGLINALRLLGIEAYLASKSASVSDSRMCFAASTRSDLVFGGAKIIGSAQARKNEVILQHGSIPIAYDEELNAAIFGASFRAAREAGAITCLQEAAGRSIEYTEVVESLRKGFEGLFGSPAERGTLTSRELTLANSLAAEKYSTLTWSRPPVTRVIPSLKNKADLDSERVKHHEKVR